MKDLEKLKKEQEELKERLLKLIAFINSGEFYSLDETEKSLLTSQRTGMEVYLNALTQRIYGARKMDISGTMLPLLMMSMYPFSSTPSSGLLTDQLGTNKNEGKNNEEPVGD